MQELYDKMLAADGIIFGTPRVRRSSTAATPSTVPKGAWPTRSAASSPSPAVWAWWTRSRTCIST
jgi:hypothetical protein